MHDADGRYIEFCKGNFPRTVTLRGLKLVVDCAHGANYRVGLRVFQELGAEVIAIGNQPNGVNINDGVRRHRTRRRWRRRWSSTRRRFRHRASTATATGSRWPTRDGTLFDGDQLLYAIVKHRHAQAAPEGRRGRHADDQLRARASARRDGNPVRARQGRRPLRARDPASSAAGSAAARIPGTSSVSIATPRATRIISALQVLAALSAAKQTLARVHAAS